MYFYVWNKLYKRDILLKNNIRFRPGVKYGEDFLFNTDYFSLVNTILTVKGHYYHYWKHESGTTTSTFLGDNSFLSRRELSYETHRALFRTLGIYDEQKKTIDEIEARQIYATASWVFGNSCKLSFAEKLFHCDRIINQYKYGYLIQKYPLNSAHISQRIQVELLKKEQFSLFIICGSCISKARRLKHSMKMIINKIEQRVVANK